MDREDLFRERRRQGEPFDQGVREIVGVDQRRLQVRKGWSEIPDRVAHFDPFGGAVGAKEIFVEVEATGEALAVVDERVEREPAVDVENAPGRDFVQQDIERPPRIGDRFEHPRQIDVPGGLRIPVRPVPVRRVRADDQRPLLVADRSRQNARDQIGAAHLAEGNQNDGLERPFGQQASGRLDGFIIAVVPRRAKGGRIGGQDGRPPDRSPRPWRPGPASKANGRTLPSDAASPRRRGQTFATR